MLRARLRLALAAALFLGWLGWLGYLAATGADAVVLSRPQFLVSSLYVVGEVEGTPDRPDGFVRVREVGGPAAAAAGVKPQDTLAVPDLAQLGRAQGWEGPKEYILPLTRTAGGGWRVTPTPPSPGYPPPGRDEAGRVRIYPATSGALRQLRQIGQQ